MCYCFSVIFSMMFFCLFNCLIVFVNVEKVYFLVVGNLIYLSLLLGMFVKC